MHICNVCTVLKPVLFQADDEGEESVDAIAKELEKSDSTDSKKSPKGGKGSPKKGKKPAMEGEKSKEEWVDLIFGANGEKVTEGGKKKGEDKEAKNDAKDGDGDADGEDFVPESDTPKTKRGGRPKKKGLDETCEGVGKLGSNMYFYDGGPYMDSDEEDDRIKDKKADSEPARKSSRANKGGFYKAIVIKQTTTQDLDIVPLKAYNASKLFNFQRLLIVVVCLSLVPITF